MSSQESFHNPSQSDNATNDSQPQTNHTTSSTSNTNQTTQTTNSLAPDTTTTPPPQQLPLQVEKFKLWLQKLNKGELKSDEPKDWQYYLHTYLIPYFSQYSTQFATILVETFKSPQTRMNLLGNLAYILDWFLRGDKRYINVFAPHIVQVFKWCYFRILYQLLMADFIQHQGIDSSQAQTILSQQRIQFDKVLARWKAPQPSAKELQELKRQQQQSQPLHDLLIIETTQPKPIEIHLPPVFPLKIMSELENTYNELSNDYSTRLAQQQQHFATLLQQYQSDTTLIDAYSDQNAYISSQSQLETWNYGDFNDDLLNSLANDIFGPNYQLQNNKKRPFNHNNDDGNDNDDNIDNTTTSNTTRRFPDQPAPCYTTDTFRLLQPSIWLTISSSQHTCYSCGVMFQDYDLYTKHTSWHQKLRTLKDEKKEQQHNLRGKYYLNQKSRDWYYGPQDWILYRHTPDHIPFQLLPWHIQEEKRNFMRYLEGMHAQQQTLDGLSTQEHWKVQRTILMLKYINTYETNMLQSLLQTKKRIERDLSRLSGMNVRDHDELDDDDIEMNKKPFFNLQTLYDSLSKQYYKTKPQQQLLLSFGNNNNNSNNNSNTSINEKRPQLSCDLCAGKLEQKYNSDQDEWVYANTIYLTHDLLLTHCKIFLLRFNQLKYDEQQQQQQHLLALNQGRLSREIKSTKTLSFTSQQEQAIEFALKDYISSYSQQFQTLVHYDSCFHDILARAVDHCPVFIDE